MPNTVYTTKRIHKLFELLQKGWENYGLLTKSGLGFVSKQQKPIYNNGYKFVNDSKAQKEESSYGVRRVSDMQVSVFTKGQEQNTAAAAHLPVVYAAFELQEQNTDDAAREAWNTYYLYLHGESVPMTDLWSKISSKFILKSPLKKYYGSILATI